jgi:tRNA(His) guanylyltransferase
LSEAPDAGLFGRGLEKLVSVSAGICSAAFTAGAGLPAHFDARAWIGATAGEVADYFAWRQADAARSALSSCCCWAMRQAGQAAPQATAPQATAALAGASTAQQNELLYRHGINLNDLPPPWQRRGIGLRWQDHPKPGRDPRTGAEATAVRRRRAVDDQLPVKDQYRAMVTAALDGSADAAGRP